MKYLNNGKQYPIDYIRHFNPVTQDHKISSFEIYNRATMMKMMVMRRVHEIRLQK
jgi:hypothetical protein